MNRRNFLKKTAVMTAMAGIATYIPSKALGKDGNVAASERIVIGMIGMGRQGRLDTQGFLCFPEAQIVATCDVYENHAAMAAKLVNTAYGNKDCKTYWDFREITSRNDIDAVFIGTTEHWHPYISIEAMKSGKDVYCEKPETFTVRDGRLMQETAKKYNRVFSGGSQRVWNDYNAFHKIIRAGLIGDVVEGHANTGGGWRPYWVKQAEPMLPGVHWDMYCGPAPLLPFHPQMLENAGESAMEFSSGSILGWGTHSLGGVVFAMGLEQTGPSRIIPPNGKDVKYLTWEYANGQKIMEGDAWGNVLGIRKGLPGYQGGLISFHGTEGSVCERDIIDGKYPVPDIEIQNFRGTILDPKLAEGRHYDWPLLASVGKTSIHGDFLYCVKNRLLPFRNIEACHRVCSLGHLGNIALYLQRELRYDPVREEIIGDPEAAAWLDRTRRAPWELPTRESNGITLEETSAEARTILPARSIKVASDYLPEIEKVQNEFLDAKTVTDREEILKRVRVLANQTTAPSLVYATLLEQSPAVDVQKQILDTMGKSCTGKDSLDYSLQCMDAHPTIRPNAAIAAIRIANAYRHENNSESIAALNRIRNEVNHSDVQKRATDVLYQISIDWWPIREWSYCGPFTLETGDAKVIHEHAFAPEKNENVQWTPCIVGWLYGRSWNLESTIASGDNCTAYMRTFVWSDNEQTARLEIGASDAVTIWFNHDKMIDQYRQGPCKMGTFSAKVKLNKGWNELLAKVTNISGSWEFTGRFCSEDGTASIPSLSFYRTKEKT